MSGISIFCITKRELTHENRKEIFTVIKPLVHDIIGEVGDMQHELSFIGEMEINGETFNIRDDFVVVYKDKDFDLNYPQFNDSKFLKENSISFKDCFSLSTMVKSPETIKFLINLMDRILSVVDGIVVINYVSPDLLLRLGVQEIHVAGNKMVYLFDRQNWAFLNRTKGKVFIN